MREDSFQKRREVRGLIGKLPLRNALAADGIDYGKICLLIGGTQFEEKLEHLLLGTRRVGGRFVYFVDDDNRLESELERFLENETRLRHGTLLRIHDEQDRINTPQHTLDFAAEIGVTWGVDDVYFCVFVVDCRIF